MKGKSARGGGVKGLFREKKEKSGSEEDSRESGIIQALIVKKGGEDFWFSHGLRKKPWGKKTS